MNYLDFSSMRILLKMKMETYPIHPGEPVLTYVVTYVCNLLVRKFIRS
jgi:hypothetical protein